MLTKVVRTEAADIYVVDEYLVLVLHFINESELFNYLHKAAIWHYISLDTLRYILYKVHKPGYVTFFCISSTPGPHLINVSGEY